jgi:hypothetical protein
MEPFFVICPHCQGCVEVMQINCAIFRHGTFRSNGEQIPPHANEQDCERWIFNNELFGCGKPFKVIFNVNNEWETEICSYQT